MKRNVFKKPPIKTRKDDLLLFCCLRNEIERLPYFIDYYREQGVTHFFIVDNDSDDGSREFLLQQPDVHYFHTTESYVSSKAGRLWTTELADFYGQGRWCLTLDVDELFVFPGIEHVTIKELTRYLDRIGAEGVFCLFLDMYSDRPLSQTIYEPGTPFLDTCRWFEKDTYRLHVPQYYPPVQIFGGPRQRMFWDNGGKGRGPSMRKVPLVRWRKGIQYYFSTHSLTPIPLADFTGALLHFKFFASFKEVAKREVIRGDRVQMEDYKKYLNKVEEEDVCFHRPESIRYENSLTLVREGVVAANKKLMFFLETRISRKYGRRMARRFREEFLEALEEMERVSPPLPLDALPQVWRFATWLHSSGAMAQAAADGDGAFAPGALLEREFERLVSTSTLRRTYGIRRWLHSRGALKREHLPETLPVTEKTVHNLMRIYESLWWDLGWPLRLFRRLRSDIRWRQLFRGKRQGESKAG